MPTVVDIRSIAFMSSAVRFGRRINCMKDELDEKLEMPNFCTKIVFGPSELIDSRSEESNPRISDVMPTIDVTPITTPSTVSAERILLLRRVSNAMAAVSPSSANCLVNLGMTIPGARLRWDPAWRRAAPASSRRTIPPPP